MGVDLATYRVRVGMFKSRCTGDKQLEASLIIVHETCGSLEFIKELLVQQGIHPNPGPAIETAAVAGASCGWKMVAMVSFGVIGVLVLGGLTFFWVRHLKKKEEFTTQEGRNKQTEVKKIHYDMIHELSKYLDPTYPPYWEQFRNLMCNHFTYPEVHGTNVTHVKDFFEKLIAKGTISYGNYDKIIDGLKNIHVNCATIVQNATTNIGLINSATNAELEQQLKDIHRKYREAGQQKERAWKKRIDHMQEQHAKEMEEKTQEIDKLREVLSAVRTSSAVQGSRNIRHRRTIVQAFLAN